MMFFGRTAPPLRDGKYDQLDDPYGLRDERGRTIGFPFSEMAGFEEVETG